TAAVLSGAGAQGGVVSDRVQPAGQFAARPQAPALVQQDQEGGLEGVLSVVGVGQDAPADPQHHRPVPVQERLKRFRVVLPEEALQQQRVGDRRRPLGRGQESGGAEDCFQQGAGHRTLPVGVCFFLFELRRGGGEIIRIFGKNVGRGKRGCYRPAAILGK